MDFAFGPEAEATAVIRISLSVRSNNGGGTVTPIAFAVLRLITRSNLAMLNSGARKMASLLGSGEHRANAIQIVNDEIEEGSDARRTAQVGMRE